MELDRFRIAGGRRADRRDGRVVHVMDMTVPGGGAVPTGGVTFVGVATTHRRQGLLTRLMEEVHHDINARGEPLAALTASEGGIYERFGYGVATVRRFTTVDHRHVQLRPEYRSAPGSVHAVDWDDPALATALAARWEQIRPLRAGEISRSVTWLGAQIGDRGAAATWVLHDDGFASWKVTSKWNDGHPGHDLELFDLAAATPAAHAALWDAVLSVDLVGPMPLAGAGARRPVPALDRRSTGAAHLRAERLRVVPRA